MKTTLFQFSKQAVFPEFSEDLPDSFYVTLASVFYVNQDIIKIHDDKNIKFFR